MAKRITTQEDFAARIIELRKAAGLEPADVARVLGKTTNAVREIENGRNSAQYLKLVQLAEALGVTPNGLFNIPDKAPDTPSLTDAALAYIEGVILQRGWCSEDEAEAISRMARRVAEEFQNMDTDKRLLATALAGRLLKQRLRSE